MTPFDWLWATARAMFERPHHQRIARVLEALDAEMLRECGCLFGGGTAMTLRYGEYRESVDLDFLVSDLAGYRQLRQALTGPQGIGALVRTDATLTPTREVRADQYGVRTMLGVDAQAIKFEIVLEARITLTPPGMQTWSAASQPSRRLTWLQPSCWPMPIAGLTMGCSAAT